MPGHHISGKDQSCNLDGLVVLVFKAVQDCFHEVHYYLRLDLLLLFFAEYLLDGEFEQSIRDGVNHVVTCYKL